MSITDVITEAMVEAIRLRLEDELIEMRDAGLFILPAANGLVVRNYDGSPSDIIRIPTRMAVRTTLEAAAPLIAGKALRDAADMVAANPLVVSLMGAPHAVAFLRDYADQIEADS